MSSQLMASAQALKISAFTRGMTVSPEAEYALTEGGRVPLSVHEYTTTGGITLIVDDDVYINAPFDGPVPAEPETCLQHDPVTQQFSVTFRGRELPARVLPLPGYLSARDSRGNLVTKTVFSHADRARLTPNDGCSFRCAFCNFPGKAYVPHPSEQLVEALEIAKADAKLPVHHVLISGGTPSPKDYGYFDDVCAAIVQVAGMPVDVMMPPRPRDPNFADRLVDLGIHGFAINIEVYDDDVARRVIPQKERVGLNTFAAMIERLVDRTGGQGRVRSLILVGLESEKQTLRGVEFLARLGCDPCLSPFRPSDGTALADHPAPTADLLERVYSEAASIVECHGVKLGPRCVPCQHNTLTFPDRSGAYFFS